MDAAQRAKATRRQAELIKESEKIGQQIKRYRGLIDTHMNGLKGQPAAPLRVERLKTFLEDLTRIQKALDGEVIHLIINLGLPTDIPRPKTIRVRPQPKRG